MCCPAIIRARRTTRMQATARRTEGRLPLHRHQPQRLYGADADAPRPAGGSRAVEWVAYASNAFNAMVPFYANVERTPEYLANTTGAVSTDNFYWDQPSDRRHGRCFLSQVAVPSRALRGGRALRLPRSGEPVRRKACAETGPRPPRRPAGGGQYRHRRQLQEKAADTLDKVLFELSSQMKNMRTHTQRAASFFAKKRSCIQDVGNSAQK